MMSHRQAWVCDSGIIFMYFKQLRVSTYLMTNVLYKCEVCIYIPVLYKSVCINEVLVNSNSTFVCLLQEAFEQCDHVL